jgi:hypothetical protein
LCQKDKEVEMNESQNTQNSEKIVLHDENGKFIKGHPKVGGIKLGEKHPISVIGTIERMFEDSPEMFLDFVDKYLRDPRNRQHIVEMIDGRPKGSDTNIAVAVQNITYSPEDRLAVAYELVAKDKGVSVEELRG